MCLLLIPPRLPPMQNAFRRLLPPIGCDRFWPSAVRMTHPPEQQQQLLLLPLAVNNALGCHAGSRCGPRKIPLPAAPTGDFQPATCDLLPATLSQVVVALDVLPLGLLRVHALIFTKGFNVGVAGALTFKSFRLEKRQNTNMSVFYLASMQLSSTCREGEKNSKAK